ncbi:MAG: hypothetical protein NT166_06455 [Candidatus Aminicenantes bacterium]|nr:hypothetical protein [Candidatus Aminicenantes bacterium]
MTARKLTIAGVIILLSCMTVLGQSPSKFKFFVYPGMSIASYPSIGFASFYNPAPNIGVGLNFLLTSRMSLNLDFNHYRFKANKISDWYIPSEEGETPFISASFSPELGDVKSYFNDVVLELKMKPFQIKKRLCPRVDRVFSS